MCHCCGLLQLHAGYRALAQSPRHLSPSASCSQSVRGVFDDGTTHLHGGLPALEPTAHFISGMHQGVCPRDRVQVNPKTSARDNLFKAYRVGKEEFKARTWLNCRSALRCSRLG